MDQQRNAMVKHNQQKINVLLLCRVRLPYVMLQAPITSLYRGIKTANIKCFPCLPLELNYVLSLNRP